MLSQDNSFLLLEKCQSEAEAFMENKCQVKTEMFILKTRDMDLVAAFLCVYIPLITEVWCRYSQTTVSHWDRTERVKSDCFV